MNDQLDAVKTMPSLTAPVAFVPIAECGEIANGASGLLLLRDPWYGCDEILDVCFDGEHFLYRGREVKPTRAIAGWAALPYKLPYLSSDPRFVSK